MNNMNYFILVKFLWLELKFLLENKEGLNLREEFLEYLCCPICKGNLALTVAEESVSEVLFGEFECKSCLRHYAINDGIPDFVAADKVSELDEKWMRSYDKIAKSYDRTLKLLSLLPPRPAWAPRQRRKWIEPLDIKEGGAVLDVATGTGFNLPYISKKIGAGGKLMAMDISTEMLKVARKRIKKNQISAWLHRANASYLLYKSNIFDAVVHVGGINTFGEKKKAIDEMIRVAKPSAQIAIVDEGLEPGKESTLFGKFMLKTNPLYAHKPPTEILPPDIKDLQIQWIWGGIFYFMSFKK